MEQFQVNKYIRLALTVVTAILTSLAAYPWTDVVDQKTAAMIAIAVMGVKAIIDAMAPGAGVTTTPTGSATSFITHKSESAPLVNKTTSYVGDGGA